MLERVKREQPRTIAMQHRAGCEHFSVDQCPTRQQSMEKPAMPVGPFHHRSDTKAPIHAFPGLFLFFSHFDSFVHSSCRTISGAFCPFLPSAIQQSRTFKCPLQITRGHKSHVRFTPDSRYFMVRLECPLWANCDIGPSAAW